MSVIKVYGKMDQSDKIEPEPNQVVHRVMASAVTIYALSDLDSFPRAYQSKAVPMV